MRESCIGTFEQPQVNGSMCVLVRREASDEFAATDPFVVAGIMQGYRALTWKDVLA